MSNVYHDHLEHLRSIKMGNYPAVSMYIPLKWADFSPGKIFSALVKAADGLLAKSGYPKLDLSTPEWERWTKQGTITLAVFHYAGVTNLIPIPTRMQPRVVVANSFHVKPIVTAAHEYIDALLLHFNESGASLYRINPVGEILIDSYLPSEVIPKNDWPSKIDRSLLREFLEFLHQEVRGSIQGTTKILGITGSSFTELRSESFWKKTKLPISYLDDSFKVSVPQNAFSIMRFRLSQIVNEKHSQAVLDALKAGPESQDGLSVRVLGTKILNKEINHLCVSLDDMHFGELDFKTGEVIVNKTQKDSKDDDLLDDLVELAIDKGVKVSVVPKKYLPNGKSFVAS
jgi:hypothetical protein